ncbi:MAG: LPS export ABC transporter ATP-binding protein [Elusimicrobia bacterium]|nr:LPS export ABC transporter ATP-binding protein [Elusimicrobiota bacterium]
MILRAENLAHYYGKRKVLENIHIRASSGEIVGLLGPNGAGKTTCFRILSGLMRPASGKVFLDNKNVTRYPLYRRARLGLGYLPQENSIFRSLTVIQNILLVLSTRNWGRRAGRDEAMKIVEEFELTRVAGQLSYTLSGGERRRLEIARAIAAEPKILMLDEPFTGIDPVTVDELRRLLSRLKERGIGIIVTDHNARETLKVIDRSYLIHSGKILLEGDAETLLNDKRARELYLGWEMSL